MGIYTIGASHEAFGVECQRSYTGSETGAIRAAKKIATQGGHGWRPFVVDADGNKVPCDGPRN